MYNIIFYMQIFNKILFMLKFHIYIRFLIARIQKNFILKRYYYVHINN